MQPVAQRERGSTPQIPCYLLSLRQSQAPRAGALREEVNKTNNMTLSVAEAISSFAALLLRTTSVLQMYRNLVE